MRAINIQATSTNYSFIDGNDAINDDGTLKIQAGSLEGRFTENTLRNRLRKELKHTNFTITAIDLKHGRKLALAAETFFAYSKDCEEGKTYGHDTITVEFTVTGIRCIQMVDGKPTVKDVPMLGKTDSSAKIRKFACDVLEDSNVTVLGTTASKTRRWMPKQQAIELAKAQAKAKHDNASDKQ